MSVFLVILAILGGLLLLFGLLLLLRVGVQLRYDGSFSVKLKVLFLSFTLFPKKEKLRIKGQLPSEKKAKKEKKKKQKKEKAVSKKPDFSEMFSFYRQLFTEVILPALGRFLKHLHLRVDQLQIEIASEDAAKTALLYGSAVSGGTAFLEFDGYIKEYELAPGQQIVVDTGYLAAMTGSCKIEVKTVPGVKNMLFGGEGIFNTVITGPGRVWLQSMPIAQMANTLRPYFPSNNH